MEVAISVAEHDRRRDDPSPRMRRLTSLHILHSGTHYLRLWLILPGYSEQQS